MFGGFTMGSSRPGPIAPRRASYSKSANSGLPSSLLSSYLLVNLGLGLIDARLTRFLQSTHSCQLCGVLGYTHSALLLSWSASFAFS